MPRKPNTENSSSIVDDSTLSILICKLKNSVVVAQGKTLETMENECWSSKYKLNGRGHVQIKYKGIKYLGHRIMACAKGPGPHTYVKYDPKTKNQASHICGKPSCINPYHLCMENDLVNQNKRLLQDVSKCRRLQMSTWSDLHWLQAMQQSDRNRHGWWWIKNPLFSFLPLSFFPLFLLCPPTSSLWTASQRKKEPFCWDLAADCPLLFISVVFTVP